MAETSRVLIVDADPSQRRSLAAMIAERSGGRLKASACATPAEALAALGEGNAVVIADIDSVGGVDALRAFADAGRLLIATSATASLNTAISAVKRGASDFLPKPIGAKALMQRIEDAVAGWDTKPEAAPAVTTSPLPAPSESDFAGFIGRSATMRALYQQIRRVAPSKAPVFITGESGTGKELCAAAIHSMAGTADRPFVAINCSAIPRELMESEIFGHVRGAFTGAIEDRPGAAELADGGTLFLDEVAEMDLGLQAKLLRFVQSGSVRRVGGSTTKKIDVRIISATNREPIAEIEAGRFRADLFYRLHVLPIHIDPLRDRREDILPLAEAFLTRFAAEEGRGCVRFSLDAAEWLRAHPWPGNVRQLENEVRRAVVLSDGPVIARANLPVTIGDGTCAPEHGLQPCASTTIAPWREQERRIIEAALSAFGGNIARAAAALDISPSTIYRKRQSWEDAPAGAVQ